MGVMLYVNKIRIEQNSVSGKNKYFLLLFKK